MTRAHETSCDGCGSEVFPEDLRCSICGHAADAFRIAERVAAHVLRCRLCGASVAYRAEARAPSCTFCDSAMDVVSPEDPVETTEYVVPFTVSRETAQFALREWLATRGFFAPGDLRARATIDAIHPVHWASWLVGGEAVVSWAADSDAGSGLSAWAPHSGLFHERFEGVLVSASRGLALHETSALGLSYRLDTAHPAASYVSDAPIETYVLQRSSARAFLLGALHQYAHRSAARHVPGSTMRNLRVLLALDRFDTVRYALPAYILVYRYADKPFRVVVHGQDAAVIVGSSPTSALRVLGVIVAACVALAFVMWAFVAVASR